MSLKVETNGVEFLLHALEESVKLQTHYAELLNMHDGGKRIAFGNAQAFIARLASQKAGHPFTKALLEAAGDAFKPAVNFTEPELSALQIAAAFTLDHELEAPPGFNEALEAALDRIGDTIGEPEGCGDCEGCRERERNLQ